MTTELHVKWNNTYPVSYLHPQWSTYVQTDNYLWVKIKKEAWESKNQVQKNIKKMQSIKQTMKEWGNVDERKEETKCQQY